MIGNEIWNQFTIQFNKFNIQSYKKKKNTSADNIHELKLYLQDGLTTCGQEAALNSGDKHGVLKSNHLDSNPASACREVKDKWWDFSTYVSLSEK